MRRSGSENDLTEDLNQLLREIADQSYQLATEKEESENIQTKFKELKNEIAKCQEFLKSEIQFEANSENIQKSYEEAKYEISLQLKETKQKLYEAITRGVEIAQYRSEDPVYLQDFQISGNSNFVKKARMLAFNAYLKTKCQKSMDRLKKLRCRVFCLEESSDPSQYSLLDSSEYPLDSNQQTISQMIQESLDLSMGSEISHPFAEASNMIANTIDPIKIGMPSYIDVMSTKFEPQKATKHNYDDLISKYFSYFEANKRTIESNQKKIDEITQKIEITDAKRAKATQRVADSLSEAIAELQGEKFVLCIDTLTNSRNVIAKAQTVMNSLAQAQNCNNKDLIANDSKIRVLISELSSQISYISDKYRRYNTIQNIEPINFSPETQVKVEEISTAQIDRLRDCIQNLHIAIENSSEPVEAFLSDLDGYLSSFRTIIDSSSFRFPEFEIPNPQFEPDEFYDELKGIRSSIIEKQREEMDYLRSLFDQLPDEIKDLHIEGIDEFTEKCNKETKEVKKNEKQAKIDIPESNPFSESNHILLEKIQEKNIDKKETISIETSKHDNESPIEQPSQAIYDLIKHWSSLLPPPVSEEEAADLALKRDEVRSKLSNAIEASNAAEEIRIQRQRDREEASRKIEELNADLKRGRELYKQIKAQTSTSRDACAKVNSELRNLTSRKEELAENLKRMREELEAYNQEAEEQKRYEEEETAKYTIK